MKQHHNYFASGVNVHNCTFHQILDRAASERGEDELYRIKDSFLYYKTASLNVSPSSPSRRSLRGKTRIGHAQDEMGHFAENEKLVNIAGLEVWRALTRSEVTVRNAILRKRAQGVVHIPPALGVAISSPWSITDPIMTLYNQANKNINTSTYTVLLPTWLANPQITFESLSDEFSLDPVSAWRDFGCRPPFSAHAFVQGIGSFRTVVRPDVLPFATQRHRVVKLKSGNVMTLDLNFRKTDRTTPRILALDAGRVKNAFSGSVAHLDENSRLVYDLFFEIIPRPEISVSFEMAKTDVIERIIDEMNVVICIGDRWQAYSINDWMIEKKQIQVANRTLKYGDFVAWRDDLMRGAFDVPRPELMPKDLLHATGPELFWLEDKPTAQLLRQSVIVVDSPGKTVEKPSAGNNDLFWSAVLAHAGAHSPEIRELLRPSAANSKVAGAIGAFATALGGTGLLANEVLGPEIPRPHRPVGVGVMSSGRLN